MSNIEELIPPEVGVLLSIKTIDELGIIKKDMLRKIIFQRGISVIKIGAKNYIDRKTLISYIESNIVLAIH